MLQRYQGKRVLVTGDTGFKGSWLSLWLTEMGADVCGFSLPVVTASDHYAVAGLNKLWRHHDGDIRDLDSLQRVLANFRPEVVFHLAAQPLVRASYKDPKTTFDTNIGGSVNVLEAVRTSPSVSVLVYITSDKCYRNREWIWGYRENEELGGHDPYSASKAATEVVFASYLDSFFQSRSNFGAASARAGNVIGGGDWAEDRIVPDCVRSLTKGEQVVVRHPHAIRPWQHVLDPLYGYLLLGARLMESPKDFSGAWNFGPESRSVKTVSELVEAIVEEWGAGTISYGSDSGVHEARLLHLNCDKALQLLKWTPLWDFSRSIQETTAWYKKWNDGQPALELSRRQISSYVKERNRELTLTTSREVVKA